MSPHRLHAGLLLLCAAASLSLHASEKERPAPAPAAPGAVSEPSGPAAGGGLENPGLASAIHGRSAVLSAEESRRVARAVLEASERHGFDPQLVLAVIEVESRFDPFAVSAVGAMGLMQILPSTGKALAARVGLPWRGARTLFDPVVSVRLGITYLAELRRRFGSLETALAAYNWGPGAIGRRIRGGAPVPAGYTRRVLDAYADAPGRSVRAS